MINAQFAAVVVAVTVKVLEEMAHAPVTTIEVDPVRQPTPTLTLRQRLTNCA